MKPVSTVTELREQNQQLSRRETLFSAAQKLARIGYCEWDYRNNRLLNCTPEYADIYGSSMTDIRHAQDGWDNFINQIHPSDRLKFSNVYRNLEHSGSYDIEYRIILPDGEIRNVWEL